MKKARWAVVLPLVGLALIGAGCSKTSVDVTDADNVNSVGDVKVDTGKASQVESDTGVDLPSDAAVTLRLSNGQYASATYVTSMTIEELKAFYDAELSSKGYTAKNTWTEVAAGGYEASSRVYESGTTDFNVVLSKSDDGTSVSIQKDTN